MKTNRMSAIIWDVRQFKALQPLIDRRPLATIPFDCKYRLIDFQMSIIANANIPNVLLMLNEGETQSVLDHIGSGKEWNFDVLQNHFFIHIYQDILRRQKEGKPKYSMMIDYLQKSESEYTVLMESRMLSNIDIQSVLKAHQSQDSDITIVYKTVSPEIISEIDTVLSIEEDGKVCGIEPFNRSLSGEEKKNLNMNTFIVQTKWLIDIMKELQMDDDEFKLLNFLQENSSRVKCSTFEYTGYLRNIVDIPSYYSANMDMLDSAKFDNLMYSKQKIYTKLKNEVPTYYSSNSSVKNSQFATGCVVEGNVENSLVSRKSKIKEGASVSHSILNSSAVIETDATVKYAILDKNVVVDKGIKIIGSPDNICVVAKGEHVSTDIIGG